MTIEPIAEIQLADRPIAVHSTAPMRLDEGLRSACDGSAARPPLQRPASAGTALHQPVAQQLAKPPSHTEPLQQAQQASGPGTALDQPLEQAGQRPRQQQAPTTTVPAHYHVNAQGLHWKKPGSDPAEPCKYLASPIEVIALARSLEDGAWFTKVSFCDLDGNRHHWNIPKKMFAGSGAAILAELMSKGADVDRDSNSRELLLTCLQSWRPQARIAIARKAGWHGSSFVLPDNTAFGAGQQAIEFEGATPASCAAFTAVGTLAQWQTHVAAPCAGNSRLVLALCAALAGPVLHLMGEDSGGFHLVGPTSIGKSTALDVASSVWANPVSLVKTWLSTSNALAATAELHNDMLLPLDELGQGDASQAGEVVYMLGNGKGKARANCTGRATATASWRLMVLSSGEVTLGEHLASAGKHVKAGQQNRLVDVPADAGAGLGLLEQLHDFPSSSDFVQAMGHKCARHHGTAGRAWVEILADVSRRPQVLDRLRNEMAAFKAQYLPQAASGSVQRVGHRFALVAAVGEAAIEAGVLPWDRGQASEGVGQCFEAWLAQRSEPQVFNDERAIEQVRRYLRAHGQKCFRVLGAGQADSPIADQQEALHGFKAQAPDGRWQFFVLPWAFTQVACAGLNPRHVTQALLKRGYLLQGTDGKNQVSRKFDDFGQARAYHLSEALLGQPETQTVS